MPPCPQSVNARLSASLHANRHTARFEDTPSRQIDVIKGALRPKFIDQEELNHQILLEMQPLFEEWAGVRHRRVPARARAWHAVAADAVLGRRSPPLPLPRLCRCRAFMFPRGKARRRKPRPH